MMMIAATNHERTPYSRRHDLKGELNTDGDDAAFSGELVPRVVSKAARTGIRHLSTPKGRNSEFESTLTAHFH